MSASVQIKRLAHYVHTPHWHMGQWHTPHVDPMWHLSSRNLWITVLIAAVLAIYVILAIWAHYHGSSPGDIDIQTFHYWW